VAGGREGGREGKRERVDHLKRRCGMRGEYTTTWGEGREGGRKGGREDESEGKRETLPLTTEASEPGNLKA
jgi:hypothetical protein